MLMCASIFHARPGVAAGPPQYLVDGNTAFALGLYRQLKSTPGNLFFSPYSISTALAMTWAGARGNTAKQMGQVLGFDHSPGEIHAGFGTLQRQLQEAGNGHGVELSVANALWAQQGHPFLKDFLGTARDRYQANVNQADFLSRADAARGEINRWVAQKTRDRIQDLLPAGSVDSLTRLVLANAVYFKGTWAKQFDKAQTVSEPFHTSATSETQVPLMRHSDQVRYMDNEEFQAVELPYKGNELSMVILLPREVEGCAKLENQLTPALLSSALSRMKAQKVEIVLPRFELESRFDLKVTLAKMGMTDAFGSDADFSGMDGTRLLYISGVFHKAWGEVNEEGTEAAAATGVVVGIKGVMPRAPVFRADHPFIFLIRDTRSGSLLFLGRLSRPAS